MGWPRGGIDELAMTKDLTGFDASAAAHLIRVIRGHRVMLDADLAALYGVETRVLIQAVKRNLERFPPHFMFQLTLEEARASRSQSVILNAESRSRRGTNIRYLPYAFTEHGALMVSSVLRTKRAVQVGIGVVEAFVRLREMVGSHEELSRRLDAMERAYDKNFKQVFDGIRQLMHDTTTLKNKLANRSQREQRPRIGFRPKDREPGG
jgi:hypothetical protein